MKIFLLYAKENWITDELAKEWIENNQNLYTNNINEADIIWILSNYIVGCVPYQILMNKKVITTIHHIVPSKVDDNVKRRFAYLNQVTDIFMTNQIICANTMKKYFSKPIKVVPLWHNENVWKKLENISKSDLRKKYNMREDDFLIGSFQKDTEGNSIENKTYMPKLEKGPDIFCKAVNTLKKKHPKLKVVLTGYRRQYVIQELEKINVEYYYLKNSNLTQLNELFNCLDLYIVGSRVEGGPRAINECSLTKTPLLSTDVGISSLLCYPKSIFNRDKIDSILECETDIEYNYKKACKYMIKNYMKIFTKSLFGN